MRKVVSIHIGGAGIRLGRRFWDVLFADHGVNGGGQLASGAVSDHRSFLRRIGANRVAARAVLVDAQERDIGALASWSHRSCFGQANVVFDDIGTGKNFARGQRETVALRDQAVARAVALAGGGGSPTFFITHSLAGGTGGGLGSTIVQKLRDDHPTATIVCCAVLSDLGDHGPVTRPYNEVLTLAAIREQADLVVLLDNGMLHAAAKHKHGQIGKKFASENEMAGRALALLTAPVRLAKRSTVELRELVRTLTPLPELNFAGLAVEGWPRGASPDALTNMRKGVNRIGGYRAASGRPLSALFVEPRGRKLSASKLRADTRMKWPAWYPPAPVVVSTRSADPSALLVENSTGLGGRLGDLVSAFNGLFKKRAFLNHYESNGVSRFDMQVARKSVADIVSAYGSAL